MKDLKNCGFQYYDGGDVKEDVVGLTLQEAKDRFNFWHDDMIDKVKNGSDIEAAIWINMKHEGAYNETLIHLSSPNYSEHGYLWEEKRINKF